ncbi:MAG TPA: ubiquitin-activating E1 FCCH domain-containing protein [Alphaproteobacteria bacterium]|nr:ubiquitin-activating E1 FCCH domain-containing protein [Alphaproteobacteria bacterium]
MSVGDLTSLANAKAWLFGVDPQGFAATQKPIQAVTQAANAQVTCAGHGFAQGQQVLLSNIGGMAPLSGLVVTVAVIDANTFSIGVDTTGYPAYTGGGVASAEDVILARLISATSQDAETYMGRAIAQAVYSEAWDGNGRGKMFFPNAPASAVSALTVGGVAIPAGVVTVGQTTPPGYYITDRGAALTLLGYAFACGIQNVQVSYTAGYATTPPDLEQAVIEAVAYRYKERLHVGVASQSAAGQLSASFSQKPWPDHVQAVLDRYRKAALA